MSDSNTSIGGAIAELIGSTEVSRRLRVHPSTVTRWAAEGRLVPVAKLSSKNGSFLFDPADVERLAAEIAAGAA